MLDKSQLVVSVDIGTTRIKVVKYKSGKLYYEEYPRENIEAVVQRAIQKEYHAILLTGSGASEIAGEDYIVEETRIPIYRLNELECVANIVKFQGKEEGLVVNVGTGTAFLYYHHGEFQHITGTGIGGGTFEGLSTRLLGMNDPDKVEALAMNGQIEKVNIVIKDIYKKNLSWLHDDITVSNFAKAGAKKEDIAIGIHSMVIEPILSMVKAFNHFKALENIYFTGGVLNNGLIVKLVDKYADFFELSYKLIEHPSFATALGALEVYWRRECEKES